MGIREALARCFGRRPRGPCATSEFAKATAEFDRAREAAFQKAGRLINAKPFVPSAWSQQIMKNYASSLGLGDIFKSPAEKVCPLTKQLIVERLRDLAADRPESMRSILAAVFEGGIVDDYELLDSLNNFTSPKPELPDDLKMDTFYDVSRMGHRVRFTSQGKEAHFLTEDPPPLG